MLLVSIKIVSIKYKKSPIILLVIFLYVKIFDCESEIDLEIAINEYLLENPNDILKDIKYAVSTFYDGREQIYCFSALLIFQ